MEVRVLDKNIESFETKMKRLKFNFTQKRTDSEVRVVNGVKYQLRIVIYEIDHQFNQNKGLWEIIGLSKVDNQSDPIITHDFTSDHSIPKEFYNVIRCDGCSHSHVWKKAHIVRNRQTSEILVLGSGCLEKYVPEVVGADYTNLVDSELLFTAGDERFFFNHGEKVLPKFDLAFFIYNFIRTNGFISKNDAHSCRPTSDEIQKQIFDAEKSQTLLKIITEADSTFVKSFVDFVRAQDTYDMMNVQTIVNDDNDFIPYGRLTGQMIYGVLKFIRHEDGLKRVGGEFIQFPAGKYKDLEVTIESIVAYKSDYGLAKNISMIHGGKYRLFWTTTSQVDIEENKTYKADMTVTETYSTQYNNTKVTRVKFSEKRN